MLRLATILPLLSGLISNTVSVGGPLITAVKLTNSTVSVILDSGYPLQFPTYPTVAEHRALDDNATGFDASKSSACLYFRVSSSFRY
ncbi:hypothetical protein FRB95_001935 [Tulasnella sp. JGI-2019a]|nr:hypothetical protein FRB95_001935 [Tulasnella sp. JGI-2019a]